jgi:hypothetical protein
MRRSIGVMVQVVTTGGRHGGAWIKDLQLAFNLCRHKLEAEYLNACD